LHKQRASIFYINDLQCHPPEHSPARFSRIVHEAEKVFMQWALFIAAIGIK